MQITHYTAKIKKFFSSLNWIFNRVEDHTVRKNTISRGIGARISKFVTRQTRKQNLSQR